MKKVVDKYTSDEKQQRVNCISHSLEIGDLTEKNKELDVENTKS